MGSSTAYVRVRLPKYEKPKAEKIENLSPSVIIDQTPLGGNARSTVGTISDMYSALRLLYSRIGEPYVGTPSCFSFNSPGGMCLAEGTAGFPDIFYQPACGSFPKLRAVPF